WANLLQLATVGLLPNGTMASDLPGGCGIPITPLGRLPIMQDDPVEKAAFTLRVAPDKKTALVTATMRQQINHMEGDKVDGSTPSYGAMRFTFSFTLNLNAHEQGQGVAGFTMGQEFIPRQAA
ncbi:MAG: hypothetical protein IKX79_00525, partial [Desulfovibrionaceae bacterium]|nr:hypothetical protein [Desulfovibrionaceae bacterium]